MNHQCPSHALAALLLSSMLLLVGCTSHAASTAQATAAIQATATLEPSPTLPPVTVPVPPNCPPVAPGFFPTGVYQSSMDSSIIKFLPNGEHIHDAGARTDCYIVSQQHILIFGKAPCYDTATDYGDYTWTFNGKALRFTRVYDDCLLRASSLPDIDWIKQTDG